MINVTEITQQRDLYLLLESFVIFDMKVLENKIFLLMMGGLWVYDLLTNRSYGHIPMDIEDGYLIDSKNFDSFYIVTKKKESTITLSRISFKFQTFNNSQNIDHKVQQILEL